MKGRRRENAPNINAVKVAMIYELLRNLTNYVFTRIEIIISKYISVTVLRGPLKKNPPRMFSQRVIFLHILFISNNIGSRMKTAHIHIESLSL